MLLLVAIAGVAGMAALAALRSPRWIFYMYMALLVFSELSPGGGLSMISMANVLLAIALVVIGIQISGGRMPEALYSRRVRWVLAGVCALLVIEFTSAMLHHNFRAIPTRAGHLAAVLSVVFLIRTRATLLRALGWASASVAVLGILTLLRSLGVTPWGYRERWGWGEVPWDQVLPRAIGISQMDSTQFAVFAVTMMPVALAFALKGRDLRFDVPKRALYFIASFCTLVGIIVTLYRSLWVGCLASLLVVLWLSVKHSRAGVRLLALTTVVSLGGAIALNTVQILAYLERLMSVRSEGLDHRLVQYLFAVNDLRSHPASLLVGFGHGAFEQRFPRVVIRGLEMAPWLHNPFLNLAYSSGVIALLVYVGLLVAAMRWLYLDASHSDRQVRVIAMGTLAGLIGTILAISAHVRVSGDNILWIVVAIAATLPSLHATEPSTARYRPAGLPPRWPTDRRREIHAVGAILVLLFLAGCESPGAPPPPENEPHTVPTRPSFILVMTDDQKLSDIEVMPNLKAQIRDRGMEFVNGFAPFPVCCPARASVLRGQYAHNHGVTWNFAPQGGYERFHATGLETSTLATWLNGAGYRNAFMGKYVNEYPRSVADTHIPPGWDEWYTLVAPEGGGAEYFNYQLNENGQVRRYGGGAGDYLTDVLSAKARAFIQDATRDTVPFLLAIWPTAPHAPSTPAPRHAGTVEARAPTPPSFNEIDVSDKVIQQEPLTAWELDAMDDEWEKRLESLAAVDEMILSLVKTLEATGWLDHTYIIFTSDNGYHMGEHRLRPGKSLPFEEDIRVPFLIRGPGVASGSRTDLFALHTDLAPTIAQFAGVPVPDFVDGRSLVPILRGQPPATWRQLFLVQFSPFTDKNRFWSAVRTPNHLYAEYHRPIDREFYDLRSDPNQLDGRISNAEPPFLQRLTARLTALRACKADQCRSLEEAPL